MNILQRPLVGRVVNISISESDDSAKRGFPTWQVNRVTLQVVAALFGQGAGVVFGHDWREDGVMEVVYGFARQMQPPVSLSSAEEESPGQPLLRNLLPWPDKPHLSERDLEQLTSTLRVECAGLPEELRSAENEALRAGPESPPYKYLRARGLTHLRHQLDKASNARLCLGGRRSGSAGRYPGVIEEALFALRNNKPLYLATLLGGATQQVVDAFKGKEMPSDFCAPMQVHDLYDRPPIYESYQTTQADRVIDKVAVWKEFQEAGFEKVAEANGLTTGENVELLETLVIDRVIQLVLTGLSRLRAKSQI